MENPTADDLVTRIAWLYHVEGLRQEDIANLLGLSRSRVLRALSHARSTGVVDIKVAVPVSRCIKLERLLETRLGLERAIVIPQPKQVRDTSILIGRALASYTDQIVSDGMIIGTGWGHTLQSGLENVRKRELSGVKVISMMGCESVRGFNPSEVAWRFAGRLSAECSFPHTPFFAPDERSRESLSSHPGIQSIFESASAFDLAIVSTEELSPLSTITKYLPRGGKEIVELQQQGAVGEVLGRFIGVDGRIIDHPLNALVLALHPDALTNAKKRVLAAGGWSNYAAICGALKLIKPHVLITDEVFAVQLSAE